MKIVKLIKKVKIHYRGNKSPVPVTINPIHKEEVVEKKKLTIEEKYPGATDEQLIFMLRCHHDFTDLDNGDTRCDFCGMIVTGGALKHGL